MPLITTCHGPYTTRVRAPDRNTRVRPTNDSSTGAGTSTGYENGPSCQEVIVDCSSQVTRRCASVTPSVRISSHSVRSTTRSSPGASTPTFQTSDGPPSSGLPPAAPGPPPGPGPGPGAPPAPWAGCGNQVRTTSEPAARTV